MKPPAFFLSLLPLLAAFAVAGSSTGERVIHTFGYGSDGIEPRAGFVVDASGDLFGTTYDGGGSAGAGTVYELMPPSVPGGTWSETILHRFSYHSIAQGLGPWGALVADRAGDLFGTAWLGGTCGSCGIVFELKPPTSPGGAWQYSIIHDFSQSDADGYNPRADLAIDVAGDIYGTTTAGGSGTCVGGCGVVFELVPSSGSWTERILHDFPAHGSGEEASGGTAAGVTLDGKGDVFGTAFEDGRGLGTVFELARLPGAPAGGPAELAAAFAYRVVYAFKDLSDGAFPMSGVTFGAGGDLYGTTNQGGRAGCYGEGCGTVFRLVPRATGEWAHQIVYAFGASGDGSLPVASVLIDPHGVVYGATQTGGVGAGCPTSGCGVLYRLRPLTTGWAERVLHTFAGGSDGFVPFGALSFGAGGELFGATQFGGNPACSRGFGCGTAFTAQR